MWKYYYPERHMFIDFMSLLQLHWMLFNKFLPFYSTDKDERRLLIYKKWTAYDKISLLNN